MHELGLCGGILEAVERRAAGRRVTRVRLRVGTLHRVSGPALDQAFSLLAGGTVAEGADIDLVVVPVRATCAACRQATEADEVPVVCPTCGSSELEVSGGDELVLESIQLQAPT
ncbi:MAG TPA: hydrogenase maturation nickel metallochaperone HypA [Actinomycetes bacterium]|jgi:hydrogenase nickel incorporation protein HypA/HybF